MAEGIVSDIAVIVPTRNSGKTLKSCLESIKEQITPCFLIVVDNHSSDSTYSIALDFADLVLTVGPERSSQRNAGARASAASIVGFIDSDMVLLPGVIAEAADAIRRGAASVIVPEETVGSGFWANVSAFERSFYLGSDTIEAPRFFAREVFDEVGGFDEEMTGAEDWDLAIRTRELGPRVRIQSRIVHQEGRVRYFKLCLKKAYYASGVVLFVKKHGSNGLGVMSKRPWLKKPRSLFCLLGLGLIVLKLGEATAMVASIVSTRLGFRPNLTMARQTVHKDLGVFDDPPID